MDALKIIVLAAGKSTRMQSAISKVCHKVGGLSLIEHTLHTAKQLNPVEIGIVLNPDASDLREIVKKALPSLQVPVSFFEQQEAHGTGDAVLSAQPLFENFSGNVLILFADTPLLTVSTLASMHQLQKEQAHAAVILAMEPVDPLQYGRIILSPETGYVERIVEYKDASEAEQQITLCNAGVMLLHAPYALKLLEQLDNNNAKGEYYLTDIVAHAKAMNLNVGLAMGEEEELLGVNTRTDLSHAEYIFQTRMREKAMENGVTLFDPETVYFSYDTKIEKDTTVFPHVTFGPNVQIESDVIIKPFCHIEGAHIQSGAQVGPFAHLRPGTVIESHAKVGNFVEVKNATLHTGAKANHLSYIGDADVGKNANIGAGTITCNYDGYQKHRTKIGDHAFIGSNTALIAPVEIGDRAIIGAGSVITRRILPDALGYTRAPQQEIIGGAIRYRRKRAQVKIIHQKEG